MKRRALGSVNTLLLFKQSIFAAPWLATAVLLSGGALSTSELFWLILAFISARTSGMGFNRLIDRAIDQKNPRTMLRPLQRGELSKKAVLFISLAALLSFFCASYALSPLAFRFSPFIASLIILYSYLKRCTWLCHFVLGLIQFFGPFFASVVAVGHVSVTAWALGGALGLSIAANDILYAHMDIDFDRQEGLYSVPACFGETRAKKVAEWLHMTAWLLLALLGLELHLSLIYFSAISIVALMWYKTYRLFDAKVSDKLFTYSNSYVALVVCTAALGERLQCVS